MSFLKKIGSLFQSPGSDRNYWFYVECDHCHEKLKGRLDLFSHLSLQYGENKKKNTYYARKVLIGSNRCYKPIEVEFTFDSSKKLSDRQISGGKFVTEEEFLKSSENFQ